MKSREEYARMNVERKKKAPDEQSVTALRVIFDVISLCHQAALNSGESD
jgi:hypothetical protein